MDMTMFLAASGAMAWLAIAWHSYKRLRGLLRRLRWAMWWHRAGITRRGW
jgi:hypothetical protein